MTRAYFFNIVLEKQHKYIYLYRFTHFFLLFIKCLKFYYYYIFIVFLNVVSSEFLIKLKKKIPKIFKKIEKKKSKIYIEEFFLRI